MRVALLTTSWPRDEADHAGRFLVPLVRGLEQAGATVEVVSPGRGFRDFGLTGGDGLVANARRRPWLVPLLLASMAFAIRRAARRADVVHAHWLLLAPIAAIAGRPVVLTLHGSGSAGRFADLELARHRPGLFRWLVERADVVVGVSQPLVEAAATAGARAMLVPHGVDVPEQARNGAGGVPVALFAGRLSKEKGVEQLAEAMRGVEGVRLVVAGDGPLRPFLPDALGFVAHERLQELYAEASMLLVPSLSEGFGVVALEAMAHGVPVVASRVGGLAWLVEDEVTGLLVRPGDVIALRAAIERLRDDEALRDRLGAAARERARARFGREAVTRAMLDAYRAALPERRS